MSAEVKKRKARKPLSLESRRKIGAANSIALKGRKLSEETKNKMRVARLGEKNPFYGKSHSIESKEKIKKSKLGVKSTKETIIKRSASLPRGEKHHFWKGGITKESIKIRSSLEYKLWRKSVFERDSWACVWCYNKKEIHADHIKPFAYYPELRLATDNGRTLCKPCHKTTDTYLNNGKNGIKTTI